MGTGDVADDSDALSYINIRKVTDNCDNGNRKLDNVNSDDSNRFYGYCGDKKLTRASKNVEETCLTLDNDDEISALVINGACRNISAVQNGFDKAEGSVGFNAETSDGNVRGDNEEKMRTTVSKIVDEIVIDEIVIDEDEDGDDESGRDDVGVGKSDLANKDERTAEECKLSEGGEVDKKKPEDDEANIVDGRAVQTDCRDADSDESMLKTTLEHDDDDSIREILTRSKERKCKERQQKKRLLQIALESGIGLKRRKKEDSASESSIESAGATSDGCTAEKFKNETANNNIDREPLPFIESIREKLQSISRNDLEELIVQKICEVITERSVVGELRRRAQVLEHDQERWKKKVQALTRELREMNMVMQNYMAEVERQKKDGNHQMVTPITVSRSVGLQVSFNPNITKRGKIVTQQQLYVQQTAVDQLGSPQLQAKKIQQKLPYTPNILRKITSPSVPCGKAKTPVKAKNGGSSSQTALVPTRSSLLSQPLSPTIRVRQPQLQPQLQPQPQPQTEKETSKVIDLTDDDDQQGSQTSQKAIAPSVTVKPSAHTKVANLTQQINAGGRVAYIVSTTPVSGSTASVQNRELAVAAATFAHQSQRHAQPLLASALCGNNAAIQLQTHPSTSIVVASKSPGKALKHPAPLPQPPPNQIHKPNWKLLPPRPALKVSKVQSGIVLSWNMCLGPEYEPIASYQLYAYQENNSPPNTSLWKKVGDVRALPLPMACTLTQFMSGHKYYFAVRAVDNHSRIGLFSFPVSIVLLK